MSDSGAVTPGSEEAGSSLDPVGPPAARIGASDLIAVGLSTVWLVLVGLFFILTSGQREAFDPFAFIMTIFAVFMPVALIWIGTSAAKNAKMMRNESERLQAAIIGMRQTYIAQQQGQGMEVKPQLEAKLEALIAAQRKNEEALQRIASRAGLAADIPIPGKAALPKPKPEATQSEQPALALGTPAAALEDPISVEDFTRALNFPENEKDKAGFRALRRALKDHALAGLIHSAQDVLTLLSEEGIYMDDLTPDRARAEIWRKFAAGERGQAIATLGGIRDRSCLALTAGRMRQDPIFRDAVHHFLRKFDHTFAAFEKAASDADIIAVTETRTARAFMLLGRVSGTFD